jgi:hypothetical protein
MVGSRVSGTYALDACVSAWSRRRVWRYWVMADRRVVHGLPAGPGERCILGDERRAEGHRASEGVTGRTHRIDDGRVGVAEPSADTAASTRSNVARTTSGATRAKCCSRSPSGAEGEPAAVAVPEARWAVTVGCGWPRGSSSACARQASPSRKSVSAASRRSRVIRSPARPNASCRTAPPRPAGPVPLSRRSRRSSTCAGRWALPTARCA